jgi:hypothetical protein
VHPTEQEREACRRRVTSSDQMHPTETLCEANSLLVLLHRVDVAVVSDISEEDAASMFRVEVCTMREYLYFYSRGADKSLAFPSSYFPICSTTKITFLGWVKEVRTAKS